MSFGGGGEGRWKVGVCLGPGVIVPLEEASSNLVRAHYHHDGGDHQRHGLAGAVRAAVWACVGTEVDDLGDQYRRAPERDDGC